MSVEIRVQKALYPRVTPGEMRIRRKREKKRPYKMFEQGIVTCKLNPCIDQAPLIDYTHTYTPKKT